jgi:hypothetical protein
MDILRNPYIAAFLAALITYIYLYIKNQVNNEDMTTSDFTKPALLNAIMVYFIVYYGKSERVVPAVPY